MREYRGLYYSWLLKNTAAKSNRIHIRRINLQPRPYELTLAGLVRASTVATVSSDYHEWKQSKHSAIHVYIYIQAHCDVHVSHAIHPEARKCARILVYRSIAT